MSKSYQDATMSKETFRRCYSLARRMEIISFAMTNTPPNGYLERTLSKEYNELSQELWAKSRGQYWNFRGMMFNKQHNKDRYFDARWLEIRLQRTHYLARNYRHKIEDFIHLIKHGDYSDIPF